MSGNTPFIHLRLNPDSVVENSFELNQSMPVALKKRTSLGIYSKGVQNLTGDEYNSLSYSSKLLSSDIAGHLGKSNNDTSLSNDDLETSSRSFNFEDQQKALITMCPKSMKILTTNKVACELFGYTSEELASMKFSSLLPDSLKRTLLEDISSPMDDSNGIVAAGKVIEVIHKDGFQMPVSLWIKKVAFEGSLPLKEKSCCILVLDSVERISIVLEFNEDGKIVSCDQKFLRVHGFTESSEVIGQHVSSLMPLYVLPDPAIGITKEIRLQRTISTTIDGTNFPVTIYVTSLENAAELDYKVIIKCHVWIFPNMSGLITCTTDGCIQSINDNLSLSLFGYDASEIMNKHIAQIIPTLVDHIGNISLYNSNVPEINMDSSLSFSYNDIETSKSKHETAGSTDESWCEVSLSDEKIASGIKSKELECIDKEVKDCGNDLIRKVNALLNSSILPNEDPLSDLGFSPTTKKCCEGDTNQSTDSAIHSNCSICKCGKTSCNAGILIQNNGKESLQSSLSNYHSADGSRFASNQPNPNLDLSQRLKSDNSISDIHDQSSFVVVEDDSMQTTKIPAKFQHKNLLPNTISYRSEVTSTPLECGGRSQSRISNKQSSLKGLQDGWHRGKYKHKHGMVMDAWYSIDIISTENGDQMLCLRIHAQMEIPSGFNISAINCTLNDSASTIPPLVLSNGSGLLDRISIHVPDGNAEETGVIDETSELTRSFCEKYNMVKTIGSGAFGFVRIVYSIETDQEYVVKFIKKEKVLEECWVRDNEANDMIPMEVSLLMKFNHPHIVRVMEYFQSDRYFCMVMNKHGREGLDLFEFIDRSVGLDESLCSYIFRQIVSAIDYLHRHGILHRDIKDENIIIDEKFTCKLIDFGSATFMKSGREFATFCGTIEYCSPEVLLGNKYRGPELEMWSLGVTLYTLLFGENPFKDIEETLKCELYLPHGISHELSCIIEWLLQPEPGLRCTMPDLKECEWICQDVDINKYCWNDVVRSPPCSVNTSSVQDEISRSKKNSSMLANESDEENLCERLEKLPAEFQKRNGKQRNALDPISFSNLNKTL